MVRVMSDYIKREDAINIINHWWGDSIGQWLAKKIKNVPSADVAPVRHGHWIKEYGHYKCLLCNGLDDFADDYCPNCGARMDGDKSDD